MLPPHAPRPPPEPSTTFLVVSGRIARADIPALCERVRVLLEGSDAELVVCDVGAVVDPDAVTVDALARVQLRPADTSRTWSAQGSYPPAALGFYCPNAGDPLATVGTRREPRQLMPGPRHHRRMSRWVRSHSW